MKTFVFGFLATAGIAVSANAAFGFSYEFSTDGGATFGNNRTLNASGGPTQVQFRVVAYAAADTIVTTAEGSGPVAAFARLTGSEILTNWGSGANDDSMGLMFRGSMPQGGVQYLSSSFSNGNTIVGTTMATSFAANQLLPGSLDAYCTSAGGAPQLQWIVRTGTMTVGYTPGPRTIEFRNNTRTQNFWYHDLVVNGVRDSSIAQPDGDAIDFNGTLRVIVPAPTSLALAGFAGLAGLRRRRTA